MLHTKRKHIGKSGGGGGATFTGKYATYREEGGVYVLFRYIYTVSERVLQWVEKGSAGIQYIERKGVVHGKDLGERNLRYKDSRAEGNVN